MKLVILDGYAENPGDLSWDWLQEKVDSFVVYDYTAPEEVLARSLEADILVTNKTVLPGDILRKLPKLKFISTLSTGYNVIDIAAAREMGVSVSNIPAYSTDGVAQLVFALLLELMNHVGLHNESVKAGDWTRCRHFCMQRSRPRNRHLRGPHCERRPVRLLEGAACGHQEALSRGAGGRHGVGSHRAGVPCAASTVLESARHQ